MYYWRRRLFLSIIVMVMARPGLASFSTLSQSSWAVTIASTFNKAAERPIVSQASLPLSQRFLI
jgi:hypothetical protein